MNDGHVCALVLFMRSKTSHTFHERGRTSDTLGTLINIRRNRPSTWLSGLLPFKIWRTLSSSYTQTHECSFHTLASSDVIAQAEVKLEFESLFANLLRNRQLTLLPSFSSTRSTKIFLRIRISLTAGVCRSRSTCDASSGGEVWCLLFKWYILLYPCACVPATPPLTAAPWQIPSRNFLEHKCCFQCAMVRRCGILEQWCLAS